MKIEMPFEFGDKLYWVNLLTADVDAKTILAEIRDDGGTINGVYLSDDGHVEVRHHYGTYDVFGSQYAFLSKEEATAWLNANYPGAILVDRTQEVTGVLSFGDVQPDKFITIPCSIDRFADLFAGCLSTTSINVNGVFAIYDTSTQNDPFAENRFVARMGDDGTPAESVCGAYLLLRTKVNADGSRSLCSIDQPEQEIVADTVKEPSPAAQLFL